MGDYLSNYPREFSGFGMMNLITLRSINMSADAGARLMISLSPSLSLWVSCNEIKPVLIWREVQLDVGLPVRHSANYAAGGGQIVPGKHSLCEILKSRSFPANKEMSFEEPPGRASNEFTPALLHNTWHSR